MADHCLLWAQLSQPENLNQNRYQKTQPTQPTHLLYFGIQQRDIFLVLLLAPTEPVFFLFFRYQGFVQEGFQVSTCDTASRFLLQGSREFHYYYYYSLYVVYVCSLCLYNDLPFC